MSIDLKCQPSEDIDWLISYSSDYFNKISDDAGKIRDRINYTAAILTLPLLSLSYFVYEKSKFNDLSQNQKIIVGVPLIIAIMILCLSIYKVCKILSRSYSYYRPPAPLAAIEYYVNSSGDEVPIIETKLMLLRAYANATAESKKQNDNRIKEIISAQIVAVYAVIPLGVAVFVGFVQQMEIDEKPKKIIVNNIDVVTDAIKGIQLIQLKECNHGNNATEGKPNTTAITQSTSVTCACPQPTAGKSATRPASGNSDGGLQECKKGIARN